MRARYPLLILGSAALAGAAGAASDHWSYGGKEGPAHWGATCKTGKNQSPIDISSAAAKPEKLPPLSFDYRPGPLHIIDTGHTVQVNVEPGSSLTVGKDRYSLVQLHFHKPSEEAVDGRHYAMVAHFVHRDLTGQLAVVAVLLKAGEDNPVIDKFWRYIPREKGREEILHAVNMNPAQLLPIGRSYFTYQGSLTTPPCTENVRWFVLKSPGRIGLNQVLTFGRLYRANARPVQPLNKRAVLASE
jgi:carbonic anhydrase